MLTPFLTYWIAGPNEFASDTKNIIQVENKGSVISDNKVTSLHPNIKSQKKKIDDKKKYIKELEENKNYPFEANIRYGTITSVDFEENSRPKCWLLDPPVGKIEYNATKLRIINRLRFIHYWIATISPRSQGTLILIENLSSRKNK